MTDNTAELEYQTQIQQDLPRNFVVHLVHGMLGQTGFRLVNTPTFVPAYILLLSGGSDFAVGLALALQALGSTLTPMISANLVGHRQRVLPMGILTGGAMRLSVLALALAGFFLPQNLALYAVIASLGLFGLFAGMQTVVFQTLLSKVIPVSNRGKLTGLRNFLAGITTAVVAWYGGHYLLGEPPTVIGYSWIFLISFGLTSAGLLFLALVREPVPPTVAARQGLWQQLGSVPHFLRQDPQFRHYVVARALTTMGRMALPFYILYAGASIGFSGQTLAVLTIAFTLAATLSNLVWGALADRSGFRVVFLGSVLLWITATLALLLSQEYWAVILVFVGIGAAQEGFRIAAMNMTLEFGHRDQLPLRLGIANSSAEAAGALAPLLGGILATLLGYESVFLAATAFLSAGALLLILRVPEPRQRP